MLGLARPGFWIGLVVALGLVMGLPEAAGAMSFVINNGLAPPNPANIIDDATYEDDEVFVRNVDCPPGWPAVSPGAPCPSPGGATELELTTGGQVYELYVMDSSPITMSGGEVGNWLFAYDSSTVTVTGGTVMRMSTGLEAQDSASITMSGGEVMHLYGRDSSKLEMNGGALSILRAWDSCTVTISGGTVWNMQVMGGSPTITMSGGTVKKWLSGSSSATITMSGGTVEEWLSGAGSSTIAISGGTVGWVHAYDSASITMNAVTVSGNLEAYDSATVTMSGGIVGGDLIARDSSMVTLIGGDFAVDGVPVPYGDLAALTGILTGTLESSNALDNRFFQGGYAGEYSGTIRLVPEPSPSLLGACALVTLALLRRRRAWRSPSPA